MNNLSWNEFDNCVADITRKCKGKKFTGVYGFPRGGICLAVALSHSLNIPLLNKPTNHSLIVDDICETGTTLKRVKNLLGTETHVWVSKIKPTWWKCYKRLKEEEWIVFPWENINNTINDKDNYYKSRNS